MPRMKILNSPAISLKKKQVTEIGTRRLSRTYRLHASLLFFPFFFSTPASPFSKRGASIKAGDTSTALIGWQVVLIT